MAKRAAPDRREGGVGRLSWPAPRSRPFGDGQGALSAVLPREGGFGGGVLIMVARLDVLGEDHDAHARIALADLERRPEALVGERRRHPDVDQGRVGT